MSETGFSSVVSRRRCIRSALVLGAGLLAGLSLPHKGDAMPASRVYVYKGTDPARAVPALLDRFGLEDFRTLSIGLKANANSADPFPASTSPETLHALVTALQGAGCGPITLAERSGMGTTRDVLDATRILSVCRELGVSVVDMDELGMDGYVHYEPVGCSWKQGFCLARVFAEAEAVVQTCCLKTHRFGGHFTMSLKNAVGAIAKHDPDTRYNYMRELHASPLQRLLIAEIGLAFRSDLILMDGRFAFTSGGPDKGELAAPELMFAASDPVAMDAVGVAVLRLLGTTPEVAEGAIFEQEQIHRAARLGLGATSPAGIELIPVNGEASGMVERIGKELG